MKHIKLYTKNISWATSINEKVSKEDIISYFLGTFFNVGSCDISEKMEQCIKVEELNNNGSILWAVEL